MSCLKFTGTLKEIKYSSSSKILKFIPDQECAVVVKDGKDETKFVALLPADDKGCFSDTDTGIVFAYDTDVCICLGASNGTWLPTWKVKGFYEMVLKPNNAIAAGNNSASPTGSNDCAITVESCGLSEQFQLVSVSEME